eukprot:364744-Chlamydomonas_euryale.AAC.1
MAANVANNTGLPEEQVAVSSNVRFMSTLYSLASTTSSCTARCTPAVAATLRDALCRDLLLADCATVKVVGAGRVGLGGSQRGGSSKGEDLLLTEALTSMGAGQSRQGLGFADGVWLDLHTQ